MSGALRHPVQGRPHRGHRALADGNRHVPWLATFGYLAAGVVGGGWLGTSGQVGCTAGATQGIGRRPAAVDAVRQIVTVRGTVPLEGGMQVDQFDVQTAGHAATPHERFEAFDLGRRDSLFAECHAESVELSPRRRIERHTRSSATIIRWTQLSSVRRTRPRDL